MSINTLSDSAATRVNKLFGQSCGKGFGLRPGGQNLWLFWHGLRTEIC